LKNNKHKTKPRLTGRLTLDMTELIQLLLVVICHKLKQSLIKSDSDSVHTCVVELVVWKWRLTKCANCKTNTNIYSSKKYGTNLDMSCAKCADWWRYWC